MKKLRWLVQLLVTVVILYVLVVPAPAEAATLKLTYPKGGEKVFIGTAVNITWTWDGDPQEVIYISLSTDEGANWSFLGTGTGGSYAWTVPNAPTDKAQIAITATWPAKYFGANFTIAKQFLLPSGPLPTFPAAPSNLTISDVTTNSLVLSWVDNASNETGFKIERKKGDGIWEQITQVGANTTSYSDTGLSPFTSYSYRVRAYIAMAHSAYSAEAKATTKIAVIQQPVPIIPFPLPEPPPPLSQTVIRLTIGSTRYYVDGSQRNMDVAPMIREGRTLLPIRFVAEPLGAALGWDTAQQKADVALGAKEVELWIGQNRACVNGAYQFIDQANQNVVPIIVPPGRTMLPLRFIAEALGCQVEWDAFTQEVTVTYSAP